MASSISLLYCLWLGITAGKICHNSVTPCRRYLQPGVTFTRPSLLGGRWPCFALEPVHAAAWVSGRRVSEVGALFSRQASQLRGHDDGVTGGSGIGVAERALSRSLPLNLPHCVLLLLIYTSTSTTIITSAWAMNTIQISIGEKPL